MTKPNGVSGRPRWSTCEATVQMGCGISRRTGSGVNPRSRANADSQPPHLCAMPLGGSVWWCVSQTAGLYLSIAAGCPGQTGRGADLPLPSGSCPTPAKEWKIGREMGSPAAPECCWRTCSTIRRRASHTLRPSSRMRFSDDTSTATNLPCSRSDCSCRSSCVPASCCSDSPRCRLAAGPRLGLEIE
jgi:hypothetical protein